MCVCVILNINQSPLPCPIRCVLAAWLGPLAVIIKRCSMQGDFKGGSVLLDECIREETGQRGALIK